MTERLITPPFAPHIPDYTPLIFLAGPVQGAHDWQSRFARILSARLPSAMIASPRRPDHCTHPFNASEQVSWEHSMLERARRLGVISFWWAAQNRDDTTYPTNRLYAQTTRIEIGKAMGWKACNPDLPVIIGYDPAYTSQGGGSESYIRHEAASESIIVTDTSDEFLDAICKAVHQLTRTENLQPALFEYDTPIDKPQGNR